MTTYLTSIQLTVILSNKHYNNVLYNPRPENIFMKRK